MLKLKAQSSRFDVHGATFRVQISRFKIVERVTVFNPVFIALALLFFMAGAAPAGAEENLLGGLLKPFVSVGEMYDSNLFRVRGREQLTTLVGDDRLADFVTLVGAGTSVHYGIGRQELNLMLKRDYLFYSHYDDQNSKRDNVTGRLDLNIMDRVKIVMDGAYSSEPQSHIDYRSPRVNKVRKLDGGISVAYEMTSGIGFQAAYRRFSLDYSLPQYRGDEYYADRYFGTLYYRFSRDTRVYATYQHDEREYSSDMTLGSITVNNSSSSDSVRIGLEKTVGPKTSISGYIGYLERRHRQASNRDFSGIIGAADITYGITPKLGALLKWERQLYEETYADRSYSVTDALGMGLVYQVSAKVKASVSDRLTWKNFKDVPGSGVARRNDFINEVNAAVEWNPIVRLFVKFGYQFSTRSSDESSYNFHDHMAQLDLSYRY